MLLYKKSIFSSRWKVRLTTFCIYFCAFNFLVRCLSCHLQNLHLFTIYSRVSGFTHFWNAIDFILKGFLFRSFISFFWVFHFFCFFTWNIAVFIDFIGDNFVNLLLTLTHDSVSRCWEVSPHYFLSDETSLHVFIRRVCLKFLLHEIGSLKLLSYCHFAIVEVCLSVIQPTFLM